jgi:hypothetical protein
MGFELWGCWRKSDRALPDDWEWESRVTEGQGFMGRGTGNEE